MSPRPFLLRLIIPFAVVNVALIGVCSSVIWWTGQRTVHLQQIQDLDRLSILVRQQIEPKITELTPQQVQQIHSLGEILGTRITLIDGSGRVLADTHADPSMMDNHNSRPEVIAARAGGTAASSVRSSDTIHETTVYVAELLDKNQPNGLVVRLSYPRRVWADVGLPLWSIVFATSAAAALAMGCLAWVLQKKWIGPVRALAQASERMSAGEWQTRVEPAGADDVRFLGGRFNVMATQAQKQLADISHQRADLQSLVDALPDPILLSDEQERIIVINTPAASLLQLTPAQALGRKVGVVVNEESILEVLEQVKRGPAITRELRLQRNGQRATYQAVATQSKAGGVLLVLRNVSALAMAVQMKTDFVANASHELRTPIAAIKAAFETLQDVIVDDPAQTQRCVQIIGGHLQRLEEMLGDLLDLSRVESPDLRAQISTIKVDDLDSYLRSSMGQISRKRGVELEFIASGWDEPAEFESDRHLVDLVIKNLTENSLKFTPAGGKVTVSVTRAANAVLLDVIDTGIGIPPEHQERVFERFYQVDAARSSAAGRGTGLGLAIVKHAVHALGGMVQLTSAVGVGTKVRCTLPMRGAESNPAISNVDASTAAI